MAPVARFGASKGTVRPFAVFGPEISVINEHASGYYIDPDDSVPPEDLYDKTHIDLGAVVGAGCQVMLMPNGALGLSVEYHKVASFGPNMDYITPHITLDVYF